MTSEPKTVPYFFLLRVQWSVDGGMAASVVHGTEPVRPGESRHFVRLRDMTLARLGAPTNADITAFVLEPDRIGA